MSEQMELFDWELFDLQPRQVKRVTWEHNIFPDELVMKRDAAWVALTMLRHIERTNAPSQDH